MAESAPVSRLNFNTIDKAESTAFRCLNLLITTWSWWRDGVCHANRWMGIAWVELLTRKDLTVMFTMFSHFSSSSSFFTQHILNSNNRNINMFLFEKLQSWKAKPLKRYYSIEAYRRWRERRRRRCRRKGRRKPYRDRQRPLWTIHVVIMAIENDKNQKYLFHKMWRHIEQRGGLVVITGHGLNKLIGWKGIHVICTPNQAPDSKTFSSDSDPTRLNVPWRDIVTRIHLNRSRFQQRRGSELPLVSNAMPITQRWQRRQLQVTTRCHAGCWRWQHRWDDAIFPSLLYLDKWNGIKSSNRLICCSSSACIQLVRTKFDCDNLNWNWMFGLELRSIKVINVNLTHWGAYSFAFRVTVLLLTHIHIWIDNGITKNDNERFCCAIKIWLTFHSIAFVWIWSSSECCHLTYHRLCLDCERYVRVFGMSHSKHSQTPPTTTSASVDRGERETAERVNPTKIKEEWQSTLCDDVSKKPRNNKNKTITFNFCFICNYIISPTKCDLTKLKRNLNQHRAHTQSTKWNYIRVRGALLLCTIEWSWGGGWRNGRDEWIWQTHNKQLGSKN